MSTVNVKQHRRRSNIGVLVGILCWVAIPFLPDSPEATPNPALLLYVLSLVFFIWWCREYAQSKGRHPAWGWLGLLGLIGLIGLVFFLGNRARAR